MADWSWSIAFMVRPDQDRDVRYVEATTNNQSMQPETIPSIEKSRDAAFAMADELGMTEHIVMYAIWGHRYTETSDCYSSWRVTLVPEGE